MTDKQLLKPDPYLPQLQSNLRKVIFGKDQNLDMLIIALLAGGSVLIEDVPGVGKTTLAKALACSIDARFCRVQFTPDLLPADVLGASVYNPVTGEFTFRKGPIFCNILLADEINRASPRTQSALLEAMNESQATIEGIRYPLPKPFMVLATQNPIEFHGTYPLPEAQLDRFLLCLELGYPDIDVEINILQTHIHCQPLDELRPVLSTTQVQQLQHQVSNVHIDTSLMQYLLELVHRTRSDPRLELGVSPRGALMLSRAAQATAFLKGRNYVLPDDVQQLAGPVLAHRILLTSKSRYEGLTRQEVITDNMNHIKVPV
ncbi:MAG: MoxR family ATPase [Sedimentisphaerales bacterium]|nr:MoxR family ATPase [Sedimentisphaerales bacterium]